MKFQPAIKWSGSKRSQSEEIVKRIPRKAYDTYYEPFCGGCSILYQLLHSDIKFNKYICSDINKGLIDLWNEIKDNPNKVIEMYTVMWNELNVDDDKERKKQYFYKVRERYNQKGSPYDFMFIMRTTTNGMPRYNSNGEFNNSFHVTRNGIKPLSFSKIINEWSEVLNKYNVQFIHQEYNSVQTKDNDFMYLDPPYLVTCASYNEQDGWNEEKEKSLLELLDKANSLGIRFALSNVIENKGKTNKILKKWSEKYNTIHLNHSYGNCNYHAKDKSKNSTDEVLIINY